MLTFPSVHPFLMALLTESPSAKSQPAIVPEDSWLGIVEEAVTQRMAPLLFHRLSHPAHRYKIPLHLLNILKQQVAQHVAWHLLLTQELRAILTTCEQRGIACVPIRGPVLAEQLYGDCSTRPMDDLDLLVHREGLSAIKDIFQHLHYAQYEYRPGFLETYSYSLEFIHPQHGLVVEPHWTLAYPPFIDTAAMEPVWARARRQHWAGIDTWILSHEDLLLHLCLHLHHKGQQAPLLWFYELAAVIRRHGATLDWNIFMNQVQLMEQTGAVADVLKLLKGAFCSTIPDPVVRQLTEQRQNHSGLPSSIIRHHILARSSLSGREELALLCSLPTVRQQLRYLSALLFPSPRYMTQRYGASTRMRLIGFYLARFFHLGTAGLRCAAAWIGFIVTTRSHSSVRR